MTQLNYWIFSNRLELDLSIFIMIIRNYYFKITCMQVDYYYYY